VTHRAVPDFWACHGQLPPEVRALADRAFELLKADPHHPSLHFKRAGEFWSVRVGLHYRALGVGVPDGVVWFWIGTHAAYDRLLG
jgi:hypothetical protein